MLLASRGSVDAAKYALHRAVPSTKNDLDPRARGIQVGKPAVSPSVHNRVWDGLCGGRSRSVFSGCAVLKLGLVYIHVCMCSFLNHRMMTLSALST